MANYKVEGNVVYAKIAKLTSEDISAINNYRALGYELKEVEKPKGKTVAEMRADLNADAKALEKFNELYGKKAVKGEKAPFFEACKFYNEWKKAQKAK